MNLVSLNLHISFSCSCKIHRGIPIILLQCLVHFESVFSFYVLFCLFFCGGGFFLLAITLLRTHKIQRSSCPFMSGQVLLLRGDLASQQSSPFQSCRARLYLQIRGALAGPLYCPNFYLDEKPDLAPAALSVSVSPSVRPSLTVGALVFSSRLCLCHSCLGLFSPFVFCLTLVICFLVRRLSRHTDLISAVSLQHICLDVKSVLN